MRSFFFLIVSAMICSCTPATKEDLMVKTAPADEILITFGSGGGFTGLWTGYQILTNGKVNQWQGEITDSTTYTLFADLTTEKLAQVKSVLKDPLFAETVMNEPGNFSYLFKVAGQDEIIWNPQSKNAENLTTLFETLTSIVEDINRADSTQVMKKW